MKPLRNACLCGACLSQHGRQAECSLRNGPTLALVLALALSVLAVPLPTDAQQPPKVPRIGYLSPAPDTSLLEAFRQGLRGLGWVEGQNIAIEVRSAEGKYERLPELAAELLRLRVDVIVASTTPAALAAKHATSTIPIVIQFVADPIGSGLVASLARPGGNITGVDAPGSRVAREVCGAAQGGRARSHSDRCPLEPGQPNPWTELEKCRSRSPGAQGAASPRGGAGS